MAESSRPSKPTVAFARNTTNVFLHLLTACNLRCRHCYINPAQHGRNMLDAATATSWLQALITPGQPANLVLLGGEPTLHPDLAVIIQAARAMGYASITVDTNGYLFHDILDQVTPHALDFFSFSLDGARAATNDAIRGEGSFEVCTRNIQQARRRGFAVSLIFTASRDNIDELHELPPLLQELQIQRFFIQVIGLRGRSAAIPLDAAGITSPQVTRSLWNTRVLPVAHQVAAAGITVSYPRVFLEPWERFECAGRVAQNYFIFPNGRVYRCPLCEDHPLHSLQFSDHTLLRRAPITEADLFMLDIPEGCVMNRLIQPGNLAYAADGVPLYQIACCLLKDEIDAC